MLQRASCFPKLSVYGNGRIIEVMVGAVSWNISGIVIGGYDFTRVYCWNETIPDPN